jgi:hypothetical protein
LNNASALWIDASLDDRLKLQEVLFPQGLVWDGTGFQTPVTCLSFYHLGPIEGSGFALHLIDAVQTPPMSLASNELGSESQASVNVGTPSIANFKPQSVWRAMRRWLEAIQEIAAA